MKRAHKRKADIIILFFIAIAVSFYLLHDFHTTTSTFPKNTIVNENSQSRSVFGTQGAVSALDGRCSDIGVDVLKEGGGAVDSAIASLLCMSVIFPSDIGIGGGGFMLVRTPSRGYDFIDFRETAPLSSTENMYVGDSNLSREGGLAVGVPGVIRGLELAHSKYGILPWNRLFKGAIDFARDGFAVNEILAGRIEQDQLWILKSPEWSDIFAPNGTIARQGQKIKNVALSNTLETIANKGADAFYKGPIAESLIKTIKKTGGIMTLEDIKNYRALHRPVINTTYHGHRVFTASAPTSGPALLNILNLLEPFDLTNVSGLTYHRIAEALKFGYSVRGEMGDPSFVDNQERLNEIISKKWADTVRPYMTDNTTHGVSYYKPKYEGNQPHGTLHISILDKHQSAVSMTATVNLAFGSRVLDKDTGIILNSQQDDFSIPGIANAYGYTPSPNNFVVGGKRPLSSTVPSIIEDAKGNVNMIVGAAGGPTIISGALNAIINTLDLKKDLYSAVGAPRIHHQLMPNKVQLEVGFDKEMERELAKRGHQITYQMNKLIGFSTVDAIVRHKNGVMEAVSDTRKFGLSAAYDA